MIWFLSGGKSTILSAIEGSPVSNGCIPDCRTYPVCFKLACL